MPLDIMPILIWMGAILFLFFAFVVFFGAPYLPTLAPQITVAIELLDVQPQQKILELGSGDGRVLAAIASRGAYAIGYELNPVLVVVSRLRCRKYGDHVRVVWGSFWRKSLPACEGIFVFLHPKYMTKLDKKITQEFSKKVKLVSFAFKIPGRTIGKEKDGVFLYEYN